MNMWTEASAEEKLKNIADSLGYFPTVEELKTTHRVYGLTGFIERNFSYKYFKEKIGIGSKPQVRVWDEEKIISEIKALKTNVFPSQSFLAFIGRNDLAGAISRNGGYQYFSEKTCLKREYSGTVVGLKGENEIELILKSKNFKIQKTSTKEHFDFLVDGFTRIDIKTTSYRNYGKNSGWFFRMGKTITADLVILYRSDKNDYFIIPWYCCPSENIRIQDEKTSKYFSFYMKDEILNAFSKNRKNESLQVPFIEESSCFRRNINKIYNINN